MFLNEIVFLGLTFWAVVFIAVEIIVLLTATARSSPFAGFISIPICIFLLDRFGGLAIGRWLLHHPLHTVAGIAAYFFLGTCWSLFKWRGHVRDTRDLFDTKLAQFIKERRHDTERILLQMVNFRSFVGMIFTDRDHSKVRLERNSYLEIIEVITTLELLTKGATPEETAVGQVKQWLSQWTQGNIPTEFLSHWRRSLQFEPNSGKIPKATDHKERIINWIILWPTSLLLYLFSSVVEDLARWCFNQVKGIYRKVARSAYKDIDPKLLAHDEH